MTKQETYIRYFETENDALTRCELKNRACKRAGNYRDIYAVVDGPEDSFAVVDLSTAIELGFGYQIAGFRMDAGIKHECVHPVISGPVSSRRYAAGETEVYVKVSGSIGGER